MRTKKKKSKPSTRAVSAGVHKLQVGRGPRRWTGSAGCRRCRSAGRRRGRICRGVDRHPGYTDEMARRLDSGGEEQGCRRRSATGRVVAAGDETLQSPAAALWCGEKRDGGAEKAEPSVVRRRGDFFIFNPFIIIIN